MNLTPDEWFDVSLEENSITAIRVKDGIFIGNHAAASDRELLIIHKITHIINCAGEEIPDYFADDIEEEFAYLSFPWHDIGLGGSMFISPPIIFDSRNENLSRTVAFIDDALEKGECVLVHSRLGVSRAPALLAGYFVVKYGWRPNNALMFLQCVHPGIAVQPPFLSQIHALALKFPVEIDIFDEEVDDTSFGLDNDQWILRNTLLNCLHHYEQEENQLYQTCIKHVDVGVEILFDERSSLQEERGKTSGQEGEKKHVKEKLPTTKPAKHAPVKKKEDERKRSRVDSEGKGNRAKAATQLHRTEKAPPRTARHQSRNKKTENEKNASRGTATKPDRAHTAGKTNAQSNLESAPPQSSSGEAESSSHLPHAFIAASANSSASHSQRRICFIDTQKGTKVDNPNSNPVFPTTELGGEKCIGEPPSSFRVDSETVPSQPSVGLDIAAQSQQTGILAELNSFVGGRGIAALWRLEVESRSGADGEIAKEHITEHDGDVVSRAEAFGVTEGPYSSCIPLPAKSAAKQKREKNDYNVTDNASSMAFSDVSGASFSRSNSILRRRCTSPCPHRVISDAESCPKGKQQLTKRQPSPYSMPTSKHSSGEEVKLKHSISPPSELAHPHLRQSLGHDTEEAHDCNRGITKILSRRQSTPEEHVDPYRRSGGLPPPLPSLSPDPGFAHSRLQSVETEEEEDSVGKGGEKRSDEACDNTFSSLSLLRRSQPHPAKEKEEKEIREEPIKPEVSLPSQTDIPPFPVMAWTASSELIDGVTVPASYLPNNTALTLSPPSSESATAKIPSVSNLSHCLPTSTDAIATPLMNEALLSKEKAGKALPSREESPLPTAVEGETCNHLPVRNGGGGLTSHHSISPCSMSGMTVAAGHEHHHHLPAGHPAGVVSNALFPSPLHPTVSLSPDLNRAVMLLDVGSRCTPTKSCSVGDSGCSGGDNEKKRFQSQDDEKTTTTTLIPALPLDHLVSVPDTLENTHSGHVSTSMPKDETTKKAQMVAEVSLSPPSHSSKVEKKKKQKKIASPLTVSSEPTPLATIVQPSPSSVAAKERGPVGSLSVHLQQGEGAVRQGSAGANSRRTTMYAKLSISGFHRQGSPRPKSASRIQGEGVMESPRPSGGNAVQDRRGGGLLYKGVTGKGEAEEHGATRTPSGRVQVRSSYSPRTPFLSTPRGEQGGAGGGESEVAVHRVPQDLEASASLSLGSPMYLKPPSLRFGELMKNCESLGARTKPSFSAVRVLRSKGSHTEGEPPSRSRTRSIPSGRESNGKDSSLSSMRGSSLPEKGRRRDRRSPAVVSSLSATKTGVPLSSKKLLVRPPSVAPPPQAPQGPRLTTIGVHRTGSSRSSSSQKSRSFSNHSLSRASQTSSVFSECRSPAPLGSSLIFSQKTSCSNGARGPDQPKVNKNEKTVLPNSHPSSRTHPAPPLLLSTTTSIRLSTQEVMKRHQSTASVPSAGGVRGTSDVGRGERELETFANSASVHPMEMQLAREKKNHEGNSSAISIPTDATKTSKTPRKSSRPASKKK